MGAMAVFAVAMLWAQTLTGLVGMRQIDGQSAANAQAVTLVRATMDADMMHEGVQGQVYRGVLAISHKSPEGLQQARQGLGEVTRRLHRDLEFVAAHGQSVTLRGQIEAARAEAQRYTDAASATLDAVAQGSMPVDAALARFDRRFEALEGALDALGDAVEALAEHTRRDSEATLDSVGLWGKVMGAAATGLLLLGMWALGRLLQRTLGGEPREAARIAQSIADGDLSVQCEVPARWRHSVMGEMAHMTSQLRELVDRVRAQAEEVSAASGQIAQGNLDLSQRTEEQASSLQQTSVSMQQLGSAVNQSAQEARQAHTVAQQACEVANRGDAVMVHVVETMQGIRDSAHRIADITSVVDSIAFQTNILALNAAVEAARAGEQGKGFAVVASEVRSLAQRTSAAAREITGLIKESVTRTDSGAAQVAEARSTMQDIVHAIDEVSRLVTHITQTAEQQSGGLSDASRALSLMDGTTQQNATLVEETAAAAESLRSQASALVDVVGRFRLEGAQ